MPRPVGQWTLPEDEEKDLLARIGGQDHTFLEFAAQALHFGYPQSSTISHIILRKVIADQALLDFDALPPGESVRINNEQHAKIVSVHRKNVDILNDRRLRYQNMLAAAQAFTPPSAEHQDFVDYLIARVQEAIAEIPTPGADPPKPTPAAFAVAERAKLQAAIDHTAREAAQDSAADVQWVVDLLDAL